MKLESEDTNIERLQKSKETTTATAEPPALIPKSEGSISDQVDKVKLPSPSRTLASPQVSSKAVGESAEKSRTDGGAALSNELTEMAPVVRIDSTPKASEEEQYRYLWDHVIVQQLSDYEKGTAKPSMLEGLKSTLKSGLSDNSKDSKSKQGKDQETRSVEREKRLIDAALYVGRTSKDEQERKQALRYLEYVSKKGDTREIQDYARSKWESLKESH